MKTQTLIQAEANIMKLTTLKKGDVVKLIDENYSSTSKLFGVVLDLLNTGKKAFIEMLVYKHTYNDVEAEIKLFDGAKDINIFPATIIEVEEYLGHAISKMERTIKSDKEALQRKIEGLEKVKEFVSGEMSKKLQEASFIEITQPEYVQEQKAIAAKIEELQGGD